MQLARFGLLTLTTLALWGLAAAQAAAAPTQAAGERPKPSSYAPHARPRARHRAYGAPIQSPIVGKHVKHKPRSAPPRK